MEKNITYTVHGHNKNTGAIETLYHTTDKDAAIHAYNNFKDTLLDFFVTDLWIEKVETATVVSTNL